jgi:hypothetical protein
MGKSISYCYKCSSLLREDDFEKGKAYQDGDRVVCVRCAPHLRGTAGSPKSSAVLKTQTPSRRIPVVAPPPPAPGTPAAGSRRRLILGAAVGASGLLLAVGLAVSRMRRETPAAPPPAVKPAPPAEVRKEMTPVARTTPDQELLQAARRFGSARPDDLVGQLEQYEKLVLGEFERTPSAAEARKEIEAIKIRVAERVKAALAELEVELKEPLQREEFGRAVKKIEDAGSRLVAPEWSLALSKRIREIYDLARRLNTELIVKAEALAAEGKTREIQEIVRRVRGWEIPALIEKIEEAAGPALGANAEDTPKLAAAGVAVPTESKPRTEEGKAYLVRWEQAMEKVAARDYTAALDELTRAVARLREVDAVEEAKQDAEDVKRLQALVKGALEETVAKPPGWMSLELRDGRKVGGRVIQVDADRAQLGGKETVFAEWSEVTAASIAALPRKAKPEPRLLAIFCLAEGDLEAARALLGSGLEAVAPKYWAWAPGARAKIPKAEGLELSAREVFYAAEREFASMKTRGLAADKYRSLRKDYLATSVVRRAIDRIERRSDACREYYFAPPDFDRAGTIRLAKGGKLESDADSDENYANQNWAEIEFYVLPGATYRAWIQAGGCCQQVFTFLWQATELTAVSQKTKKPASADVGSNLAPEIRPSVRGLKPMHDPKTPKAPARWEWIELPLPKYSGPGPKRVRIMTDQKGFAIGALVVSSSRKAPPKDEELRELDKGRALELPPTRTDPDLVAWFPLDDGTGAAVEDAAGGHKGTVNGKPSWVAGKVGGALDFDGQTYVSAGDAEDLRLTGDITIAFWMNKKAPGGDWQRLVGKGDEKLRSYGCWTGGEGENVLFQQYNEAAQPIINIKTQRGVQIGKWHHFAATVQGTQAVLYLDGARAGEGVRTGTPAKSNEPLLLGWGGIHAKFTGSLDDVRIYKRSLAPEEVRELFNMGQ